MKHRKRNVLIVVVSVLGLVVLDIYLMHNRQVGALDAYRRVLTSNGEKLTIVGNIPKPVPEDQNGAPIVLAAMRLLSSDESAVTSNPPPAMQMVAPGRAMIGWQQPDIRSSWQEASNTWDQMETDLSLDDEALTLLAQIMDKPFLDFHLDYAQGPSLPVRHLVKFKVLAQRLCAAALCNLHHHDDAAAGTNVLTALALVRGMGDETILISQLVRYAMAAITFTASWELLQSTNLTDAQLTALQKSWMDLKIIAAAEQSLSMERAFGEMMAARLRASPSEIHSLYGVFGGGSSASGSSSGDWFDQVAETLKEGWHDTKNKGQEFLWQVAWSYPDQLRSLKGYQVLLESTRMVQTNEDFNAARKFQTNQLAQLGINVSGDDEAWLGFLANSDGGDLRRLFSSSVEIVNRMLPRLMSIEASREIAITAIALKRYQLLHSHYPETLAELTPELLPSVPPDPADGQPLRYRRNGGGTFTLYSIGDDGIDDGGDPGPTGHSTRNYWLRARDWVWPVPATAKEIEKFSEAEASK